jgi:hypothetical protein
MVPLQIIANLSSPGLAELIGMRKKLHIDRYRVFDGKLKF